MATTPLSFPHESTGSTGLAAPLPTGATVAHLTIEGVLHEGLHSVVYLVRDPNDQMLALMEYFPRALALRQPDGSVRARQAGDAIALSVGREAFVLEANTLERIEHAGIVRVLGSLQAHRTVYRAMNFIDGPTLERHIGAHGRAASAGAVVRLLDQLLDVLDALHRAGVVHGCVRPDQILVIAGERPVLLGMGSAGAEIVGHEAGPWSAPEQAATSRHDRINSATDLYMVAATAWCYATGDTPPALRDRLAEPDAWNPAMALADLPEAAGDPPGTRARLVAALSAALALLPSERPQRVADLRRILHPGGASARFEPSGAVPLWVGAMPDRDAQWQVFEKEIVHDGLKQASPSPSSVPPATTATDVQPRPQQDLGQGPMEQAQTAIAQSAWRWWWIAVPVLLLGILAGAIAMWSTSQSDTPLRATVSSGRVMPETSAASAPLPVAVTSPAAQTAPPRVVANVPAPSAVANLATPPVVAPSVPQPLAPAAAPLSRTPAPAPAAARPKPAPAAPQSPRAACGNRSQFALLYCMQDQCSKPALRNHPQCNELRRSGDIQ